MLHSANTAPMTHSGVECRKGQREGMRNELEDQLGKQTQQLTEQQKEQNMAMYDGESKLR